MGVHSRLFRWLFRTRKVDEIAIPNFKGIMQIALERRGHKLLLTDPLLGRLVHEAYLRAADAEVDRIPRYGVFVDHIEDITAKVAASFGGQKDLDPVIDRIVSDSHADQSER
jgi:hypothetical protein